MFQSSPQVIEELRPGESRNFTVKVAAAPDSAIGTLNFAAYVSSSELIRQRYKPGYVNVSMPGYPSSDFYIVIAFGAVAAIVAKKFLSRRKAATKEGRRQETPSGEKSKPGTKPKGKRDAGRRKLVELVREELGKGTSEKKLRKVLASNGISKSDIDEAFREAKKK
jgi:hypothetical protein